MKITAPETARPLFQTESTPLCLTCFHLVQCRTKRNQNLTFLSDGNKEQVLKLQMKPRHLWVPSDFEFVLNLYKGTREPLTTTY